MKYVYERGSAVVLAYGPGRYGTVRRRLPGWPPHLGEVLYDPCFSVGIAKLSESKGPHKPWRWTRGYVDFEPLERAVGEDVFEVLQRKSQEFCRSRPGRWWLARMQAFLNGLCAGEPGVKLSSSFEAVSSSEVVK